jgi:cytochrome c553
MNYMHQNAARPCRFLPIALCAAVALCLSNTASAADEESVVKDQAAVCAPCHGTDGNGAAPNFPKLAGQYASYLAAALKNYRSGVRQNAIMNGIAKDLTDEAIEELAHYYAALPGKLSTLPQH